MKLFVLLALTLNVSLFAQEHPTIMRGEVNGALPGDRLFVEVYELNRRTLVDRVPLLGDGRFEVAGVHSGNQYEVRVVRSGGERVQSEEVFLSASAFPVSIQLPESSVAKHETGAVSMYRLRHQVPAKAMSEFKKAEQAWGAGKKEQSIGLLEHALKLDPGYVEAHNNLGTKYIAAGDMDRAAVEFREAIKLDPNAAFAHLNLAICLLSKPDDRDAYREAEMHARKALQFDPASLTGRYLLGLALSNLNKEEALPYLRASAEKYPRARLAAVVMLERMGRNQEARQWRAEIQASEK